MKKRLRDFPVESTSVETRAIRRVVRVLKRLGVSDLIDHGGVYNCRPVAGSTTFSQHSWGNAVDLFPTSGGDHNVKRHGIAANLVWQATHRTFANRGLRIPVAQVIDHDARRIWEPARGWFTYTGTTGDHVHVSGAPMFYGRPPCA